MKSLRTRIGMILALSAALPLVVMAFAQARFSARVLEASQSAVNAARLDALANELRDDDAHFRHEVEELALRPASLDAPELDEMMNEEPRISRISVLDRGGTVKLSSDPSVRGKWFGMGLSDLFTSGLTQVGVEGGQVQYLAAIRTGGHLNGAVLLEVPLGKIAAPLQEMRTRGLVAVLHDRNGRILWRPGEGPIPDADGST
ncbi:MAG: hypothetical protein ACXWLM_12900, partial [Myxococcales bacterium]